MKNQQGLQTAWTLFSLQTAVTACAAVGFGLAYGRLGIISAIMGGASGILPAAFSAQILFRSKRWDTPKQWLRRAFRGEISKLLLSVVCTGIVFSCVEVMNSVVFITWISTLVMYKLLPVMDWKLNKSRMQFK